MALVRERTIPTERPPPVVEVSANFCGHIILYYIILYYIILYYIILYYIILYYIMGPPSYMWSVVDRNVVMRRIPVKVTLSLNLIANHTRQYKWTSTNQSLHHTDPSGAASHPGRPIPEKRAPIPKQQDAVWTAEGFYTLATIGKKVWEHSWDFYVLLTIHPCIIFRKQNQLRAQIFLICLLLFSTCFGQLCAHHQEKIPYLCDTRYLSLYRV